MMLILGLVAQLLLPLSPAFANCVVHVDGAESLFKKTTAGFGPANAKILQDLTADALSERGYKTDTETTENGGTTPYTHRLNVQYVGGKSKTHRLVMELEKVDRTKGAKPERILLAKRSIPNKLSKSKKQEEVTSLYESAEDKYFSALKKLPACK